MFHQSNQTLTLTQATASRDKTLSLYLSISKSLALIMFLSNYWNRPISQVFSKNGENNSDVDQALKVFLFAAFFVANFSTPILRLFIEPYFTRDIIKKYYEEHIVNSVAKLDRKIASYLASIEKQKEYSLIIDGEESPSIVTNQTSKMALYNENKDAFLYGTNREVEICHSDNALLYIAAALYFISVGITVSGNSNFLFDSDQAENISGIMLGFSLLITFGYANFTTHNSHFAKELLDLVNGDKKAQDDIKIVDALMDVEETASQFTNFLFYKRQKLVIDLDKLLLENIKLNNSLVSLQKYISSVDIFSQNSSWKSLECCISNIVNRDRAYVVGSLANDIADLKKASLFCQSVSNDIIESLLNQKSKDTLIDYLENLSEMIVRNISLRNLCDNRNSSLNTTIKIHASEEGIELGVNSANL